MGEMKEHPIIFSGEMVKAILEGRKTQTRRVIKPMPIVRIDSGCWYPNKEKGLHYANEQHFRKGMPIDFCPYGQNRLWVKETFRIGDQGSVFYKADESYNKCPDWKSSYFMSRHASRITLEIINIGVERIQEISEEDSKAEGVEKAYQTYPDMSRYKLGFAQLWNSINAKRGFGWDANPWVWVIEFQRREV